MPELEEKQEGQKTVVAFVAGLLIGGLLVWVFSASPETNTSDTTSTSDESTQQTDGSIDTDDAAPDTDQTSNDTESNERDEPEIVGEGRITVADQAAGSVVVLDAVSYPTNDGWIVVRDLIDGEPGSILGAARYSQNVGLTPTTVNLLRATEVGSTYQIVFFNENGDRVFDLEDDVEIQGYSATFVAE